MQVHELKPSRGARKKKHQVGRGRGSGSGKTSGRGHKGQNARAGRGIMRGSEGGQMALIRRLPKVGFRSHRPILYQVVQVGALDRFENGAVVDGAVLKEAGMIRNAFKPFKILGNGEISKPLTVKATQFSKTAEEKITKAGGKVELFDKKALQELKARAAQEK
ncbi:MAG: 50S ribosomal protein L15 [Candidatus Omnitrophota bacterium]